MTTRLRVALAMSDFPAYMVAGQVGVNHTTISKYARGHQVIKEAHLIRLAAFFDLKPEELRGDADEDWTRDYILKVKGVKV